MINYNNQKKKITSLFILILMGVTVPGMFLFVALHIGLFSKVSIAERQREKIDIVFLEHQGDYNKVGKRISKVKEVLAKQNIECKPVALFYDPPQKVYGNPPEIPKKFLKSGGGCIFPKGASLPDADFKYTSLTRNKVIEVSMEAHPAIATRKTMMSLNEYMQENHLYFDSPILAIFDGLTTRVSIIKKKI